MVEKPRLTMQADGKTGRKPREKLVHMAHLFSDAGAVSALCFTGMFQKINLKRASWTNREAAVNCESCLKILREEQVS